MMSFAICPIEIGCEPAYQRWPYADVNERPQKFVVIYQIKRLLKVKEDDSGDLS
jgi:hypothetical protein